MDTLTAIPPLPISAPAGMIEVSHWRNVTDWPPWCTHFSPEECACRGTGKLKIELRLLWMLETLRARLGGKPMILNSVYRSPEHNEALRRANPAGVAQNSQHLYGRAADVAMANHDPNAFVAAAAAVGFTGIGTYPQARNNFVHIDCRLGGPVRWGQAFPASTGTFSAGPLPEASLRPAAGGAAVAGGAAAVTAAAEIVQVTRGASEQIQAAQGLPVWLIAIVAVLALGGAGVAIWQIVKRRRQEQTE